MVFFIISALLVVFDQISKVLTTNYLKPVGSIEIIHGILSLTYVENRGAAFGILQNSRWIFITFTIVATIGIVYYKLHYKTTSKLLISSLSLIFSGAIGNLIDRIFLGYVVDMIEVTFINYPVFNIADCFVVTGTILLAIYILFIYKEPAKEIENNEQL